MILDFLEFLGSADVLEGRMGCILLVKRCVSEFRDRLQDPHRETKTTTTTSMLKGKVQC